MSDHAHDLTPIEDIHEVLNSESERRRRSRWIVVFGLLLVVGAVVALGSRALRTGGPTYETTILASTDLEITVTAVGTIEPLDEVEVGSELSGVLTEVLVDAGEAVDAGVVLARLDPAILKAQVEQARAGVAGAEAGLAQLVAAETLARQQRDIATDLAQRGAQATEARDRAASAFDQATAAKAAARAQLRASRAALDLARINLAKSVIRAPISGVVLTRNAEVGQSVVSSRQAQTLFTIAQDLGNMQVVLEVDEADIARVRAGQAVRFTVAAFPQRTFEGSLMKVSLAPKPMKQVVTYEARVAVDNTDKALVPGMTATATVVAATHEDVLVVPNGALRFVPSDAAVEPLAEGVGRLWTAQDEGSPVAIEVEVGPTNGRVTRVEGAGLAADQEVLLSEVLP